MPVEISVGPPVLTISHGSAFVVTDLNSQIAAESGQGVFAGTRFVSEYALFTNGEPWVRLSSSKIGYFAARIYLTKPQIATEADEIRYGTLALTVSRAVGEGIHEDLDLTNYGLHAVRFVLEIAIRSDFADLFEDRKHRFVRRGRIDTESAPPGTRAATTFFRTVGSGSLSATASKLSLAPTSRSGNSAGSPEQRGFAPAMRISTRLYRQSVEDMGALCLYEHDLGADVWLRDAQLGKTTGSLPSGSRGVASRQKRRAARDRRKTRCTRRVMRRGRPRKEKRDSQARGEDSAARRLELVDPRR